MGPPDSPSVGPSGASFSLFVSRGLGPLPPLRPFRTVGLGPDCRPPTAVGFLQPAVWGAAGVAPTNAAGGYCLAQRDINGARKDTQRPCDRPLHSPLAPSTGRGLNSHTPPPPSPHTLSACRPARLFWHLIHLESTLGHRDCCRVNKEGVVERPHRRNYRWSNTGAPPQDTPTQTARTTLENLSCTQKTRLPGLCLWLSIIPEGSG